jgi:pyrimidine operon attenuation protein / uracil phosphoribosyltransferase
MNQVLDAAGVAKTLDRLAGDLLDEFSPETETVLIGIRSRGVPLAHRLASRLSAKTGKIVPVGTLDITLYRDDLHHRRRWPIVRGTQVPFGLDDRRVILMDDVLFTGRTSVAALAALADLGRPAVLRLAVLVDRGHREYPVQADYVGLALDTAPGDRVNVRLSELDEEDEVVIL